MFHPLFCQPIFQSNNYGSVSLCLLWASQKKKEEDEENQLKKIDRGAG